MNTISATLPSTAPPTPGFTRWPYARLEAWGFVGLTLISSLVFLSLFARGWDGYQIGIYVLCTPVLMWGGFRWAGLRRLLVLLALALWMSVVLYHGEPERGQAQFLLKYWFASQSAIMWMCALVVLATLTYWLALILNARALHKPHTQSSAQFAEDTASGLTWCAVFFGYHGLLVRWQESYMLGPGIGHIPVSNLYEVSILFCLVTMLMLLYHQHKSGIKTLGAFVMLIVLVDVVFTLWYALSREAYTIQPLIPALQSWWMKIHVPANFIGYGAFAAAAMLAVPHLLASASPRMAAFLPAPARIEEIMYRLIALGFVGFTIATILGALWAAEAWGAYWQWDPKETWALIVWLNYAAWLHIRHLRKVNVTWLSWWAIVGLLVTAFAFYGVNMFLSGLHSYGSL